MKTVFVMMWQDYEDMYRTDVSVFTNKQDATNAMNSMFNEACETRDIEYWERCDSMIKVFKEDVVVEEWSVQEAQVQSSNPDGINYGPINITPPQDSAQDIVESELKRIANTA